MKKTRLKAAMAALAVAICLPLLAQGTTLKVGERAPDFTLPNQNGQDVKLSDFAGKKNVVLAFYVLAFTGGWTKELQGYQADLPKLENSGTQVLGVSVDSVPANHVFAKQIGVTFPLLSDFMRTVSKQYGILNAQHGFANRTTFVIDKHGIIRNIHTSSEALDPTSAVDECSLLEHRRQEKNK